MPFTKFTNLDFDQIKTSIKDYLRANSNFTDFDFEGSNFSVLIDILAYNTYITAFNTNMVVNESFLDSATLRENVVSLARNIGYVPRSKISSKANVSFNIETNVDTPTITLKSGLVCVGSVEESSYIFSIPDNITLPVKNGICSFENITIYQGTFLTKQFTFDGSLDQRFILDNTNIDSSTIRVYIKGIGDDGLGIQYSLVDDIINVNSNSEIYLIQEIKDQKYEILFGDGIFGKKLENNSLITVTYIVTDGKSGNGASDFVFSGTSVSSTENVIIPQNNVTVNTNEKSQNGSDIEPIDSIRYFAPRLYSSQYRAVTTRDYESIIQNKIYPQTESISVIGGEELNPPQFGTVVISIKPKNGTFVSDFDKAQILSKLKQYSMAGINQKIIDLKILYVEVDSSIYYDYSQVSNVENLKTKIQNSLTQYSKSTDLNKFGGRFKYSKVLQVIDNTDSAITSNITKIKIRRDLKALINQTAQYELCFGNKFHVNLDGYNIKSTAFKVPTELENVYFTDIPNSDKITGTISIVKEPTNADKKNSTVVVKSAGTVNYETGEIIINPINIASTELENDIIEIQAFPESNDIIGLKELYLVFDISKSKINMIKDVITSGEDISGIVFSRESYTSSYSNGELKRV